MPRPPRPPCVWILATVALAGCDRQAPPGEESARPTGAPAAVGSPTLPDELTPKPGASSAASAAPAADAGPPAPAAAEHTGPWFVVTSPAAAVYPTREFDQKAKLGYVRSGGKIAVKDKPVPGKSCSSGWLEVVSGGWVCSNLGTTDLNHPQVKFAIKQPDWQEVLPYPYARNAKNGTPLYRSVPSRDQMHKYEPYLAEAKAKRAKEAKEREAKERDEPESEKSDDTRAASLPADPTLSDQDGGAPPVAAPDAGLDPWWQRDDAKDKLHEITLNKLKEDSDDILAQRMVTGFYIAVDKTFSWNGRTWYKSTKGLIAPADRFWLTAGAKFKGIELDGTTAQLPVGWVYGGRKTAPSYEIDLDTKKTKPAKAIEVFTAILLTGREEDVGGARYSETRDGTWVKNIHIRVTRPGPAPKDLKPGERWVDVNLGEQTLVVYQGDKPVYATLISSGKKSAVKDKDHATPTGQWRMREKHVTTTMDGDGSAAGDLPYSIEDVPYVLYFHNSYALHGAFWHRNFGVQMSHGCVNLAPLDAKWVFSNTDPPLPPGWHGAWSSAERPGSLVVIHD
ncbi:MAG: L,D-transpeptidase [Myxococcales bacterium]|nr:L,D-transpeptidase [Myxococcales bacterium]